VLWSVLLLMAAGASAGFLGGLLGIGGGLLVVAALSLVLPGVGFSSSEVMHVSIATSMATIVLTMASSSLAHLRRSAVLWPSWLRLAPGMVLGGVLGARIAESLPEETLRVIVAAFCGFMAWRMAFGKKKARTTTDESAPRSLWLVPAGGGIGVLSAVVGIGGGSMTVPLLVGLGVKPVKAVGTSSLCGVTIAVVTTLSYMFATHAPHVPLPEGTVGDVYLPAAVAVALASTACAPLGARLAHALSDATLKRVFSGFLIVVGILIATGG
jgi:uncharacterized membrane protein YfcA